MGIFFFMYVIYGVCLELQIFQILVHGLFMEFVNFIEGTKELPGVVLSHGCAFVANLELYPKLLLFIVFEGKKFLLFAQFEERKQTCLLLCLHIM